MIPRQSLPSNMRDVRHQQKDQVENRPYDKSLKMDWGRIMEVNDDHQVQVRLLDGTVLGGENPKRFFPLITQLSDIETRWGGLEKEMVVRIWWRGQEEIRNAFIEVIGDKTMDLLRQEEAQKPAMGSYKIMSPGLGI